MNDVWPPPPENQPERGLCSKSTRGGIAGILYCGLGSLLLFAVMLGLACCCFTRSRYIDQHIELVSGLLASGFLLIIVGSWAGYHTRSTKNGYAALVVSCVTIAAFGALCFLTVIIRQL